MREPGETAPAGSTTRRRDADAGLPVRQISATTLDATRSALAMIVRPGPTPSDVGRKLPSTAKTSGFAYMRQSGVEHGMGGVVAEAKGPALMGDVLVGRVRLRERQYTAPTA